MNAFFPEIMTYFIDTCVNLDHCRQFISLSFEANLQKKSSLSPIWLPCICKNYAYSINEYISSTVLQSSQGKIRTFVLGQPSTA